MDDEGQGQEDDNVIELEDPDSDYIRLERDDGRSYSIVRRRRHNRETPRDHLTPVEVPIEDIVMEVAAARFARALEDNDMVVDPYRSTHTLVRFTASDLHLLADLLEQRKGK